MVIQIYWNDLDMTPKQKKFFWTISQGSTHALEKLD